MNAIEFAIQMELEGERYYLEQGEKAQHAGLKAAFDLLATEEREHANLLENYAAQASYELLQSRVAEQFGSVFESQQDLQIDFKATPEQIDAYKLALEKEKESINLYAKMGSEASSEEAKKLFAFLVEQETIHFNAFRDLIEYLRKAEQWVESAEFGLREDY